MLKWIEIDKNIISNNIKVIKSRLNKKTKLMAVVKANAYGHGIAEVSQIAEKCGCDMLGVLTIDEAREIKRAGISLPVMILAPCIKEEILKESNSNFVFTIDNIEDLLYLDKRNKKINFNLDIDTGLKRWGINIKDFDLYLKDIRKLKNLNFYSISTHIAYTPYKNKTDAWLKLNIFKSLSVRAKKEFPDLVAHCANSLVLCDFQEFQLDMVRIGNLIYGIYPSDIYKVKQKNIFITKIKRPWKFFAKIISVKKARKGESFGYAGEIVANRDMRIAAIAVGYSDGLTMEPQDNVYKISEGVRYWAMIGDKKAPFVSKSSISTTLLDITDIPQAKVGTNVSLAIRRTAANYKIPRIYK
jgi:alanine racemase